MSPEELRRLLEMLPWWTQAHLAVWVALGMFVMAAAGAWFGAYFREKGKNFATKEDLDAILDQLRQTTRATEEIKAQTSGKLWAQQVRWNFRRDVYIQLLESLEELRVTYKRLEAFFERMLPTDEEPRAITDKANKELGEDIKRARDKLRRAMAVAGIILSDEALVALRNLGAEEVKASEEEGLFAYLQERRAALGRAHQILLIFA